jgi:ribosomal protein S27AE
VLTAHDDALLWWREQVRPCPRCGGDGVLVVVEVTDESTRAALRGGMACLGDCCIDGLAPDRQCVRCGHAF